MNQILKMRKILLAVALIGFSSMTSADSKHHDYQARDWVKDGVFTQGIEGPAVSKNGTLFAANFANEGTIGAVDAKGNVSLFLTLPKGSIANGIRFDKQGNMYFADYVGHNILKFDAKSKVLSVYAHQPKMNQPNDIAIADNGLLFASDPNWAKGTGQLWLINQQGQSTLVEKGMGTTNGIEISPDGKTLFVNESVQRKVWQYDLSSDGKISNKRLLIAFKDYGLDGMRTDKEGNLYIARYGAGVIVIVSPQGKVLKTVKLKGQYPTNVAFGGVDGKSVFVTMQKRGSIEVFTSEYPGRSFAK